MSETRHNLELRGHIRTAEPYANSPDDCKVESGPDKGLQKLPRIGGRPFIAASAIRGMLRRAAALEAVDLLKGKVKFTDWLLFSVGGVKGSGDDRCDPNIRHDYIEGNPLVALFGAGEAAGPKGKIGGMIGSKLHIAHAIADDESIVLEKGDGVIGGARAHENTSAVLHEVVEDMDSAAKFTQLDHRRAVLEREIKNLNAQIGRAKRNADGEKIPPGQLKEWEKELADKKAKLNGKKGTDGAEDVKGVKEQMLEEFGTDNPIGMPLTGYEAIPAGIRIRHRMTLAAVNSAQLGMFFSALERFALNPVVGAHRGHRCGRIRCEYDVYEHKRDEQGVRLVRLGRLVFGEPDLPKPKEPDAPENPPAAPKEIPVFTAEGEELRKLRVNCANWRKEVDPENLRPYPRDGTEARRADGDAAQ